MSRGHGVKAGLLLLLLALVPPSAAEAQESGEWTVEGELGGALFFGSTSQTTFTTRIAAETADSSREFSFGGQFSYGEATDSDGRNFVNTRSWTLSTAFDHRPFARWSPFVFAELESALERRITLRWNAGSGARYLVHRSDRGRLDASAALLGERTHPREREGVEQEEELLARWSVRLRGRRSWGDDRFTLNSVNYYRPRFDDTSDFTFTTTSSLAFAFTRVVSLKLTLVDVYDSQAEERGARSNNDGRFLISVLTSF